LLKRSILSRLVLALAAFKLALGLVAFFMTDKEAAGKDAAFPYVLYGLFAFAFGVTAAVLLLGGRRDRHASA